MNAQPRVVHVTTVHSAFDPRIFYKQLRSLHEAGFDAHLVAPHERTERVEGIKIHGLDRPQTRGRRLLQQLAVFRRARALNADLYQIHDPELIPIASLLQKATEARVIYDMHENYRTKGEISGRLLRALERWCFRWADHVLLAEESYRPIVNGHAVPHTYIANYFEPIEANGFPDPSSTKSLSMPVRLLYTGTISGSRGLHTMLNLAAHLRRKGRSEVVEVVGVCHHEDQRRGAERRIQQEGLDEVIEWRGRDTFVSPSEMHFPYRRADAGLALFDPHPNHRESLPTKFYEYLQYGLPIICSDFPRWRRFVEQHECGVVVPPNDPEAVLAVLDEWEAHPDQYQQYLQNALAAAPQYRWSRMEERLVSLYQDLLGTGPS